MKGLVGITAVVMCGFAGAAIAGTGMTSKEQWACEVAMCMSNPSGPTAVAECEAPIRKMLREQAKGNVIPKCKFLSGGDSGGGGGDRGGGGGTERPPQQAN